MDVHSELDLPWGYGKDSAVRLGEPGSRVHTIHHRTDEGAF
jgi:hypothetical protein